MRRRQIILTVSLAVAAALILLIIQILQPAPNVQLDYAPDGAKVVLDGDKAVRPGKFHVPAGQHTLKATLDGFTEASERFTASVVGTEKVVLLLNPNSPLGYAYLANHPSEELHREAIGGQKFTALGDQSAKRLPLIKDLPFIDQLYRVDYGPSKQHPSDPNAFAIYITYYSDAGKQQALQWLQFKGYNPNNLEVIYQHD